MTDSHFSPQHRAPTRQRSTLSIGLTIIFGVIAWLVTAFTVYAALVYTST